jgi:hypothetical protein
LASAGGADALKAIAAPAASVAHMRVGDVMPPSVVDGS